MHLPRAESEGVLGSSGEGIEDIRLNWMHPFMELRKKSHAGDRWPACIEHKPVDTITKKDRIDIRHAMLLVIMCHAAFYGCQHLDCR